MIVVDTNVIAALFVETDLTPSAQRVHRRDPDWIVPALWRHEFLNVLVTLARQEALTVGQAQSIWRKAIGRFDQVELHVEMASTLTLAVEHAVSGYDAQFMKLARTHGVRCVTEDRALQKKFPDTALSMRDFLS